MDNNLAKSLLKSFDSKSWYETFARSVNANQSYNDILDYYPVERIEDLLSVSVEVIKTLIEFHGYDSTFDPVNAHVEFIGTGAIDVWGITIKDLTITVKMYLNFLNFADTVEYCFDDGVFPVNFTFYDANLKDGIEALQERLLREFEPLIELNLKEIEYD